MESPACPTEHPRPRYLPLVQVPRSTLTRAIAPLKKIEHRAEKARVHGNSPPLPTTAHEHPYECVHPPRAALKRMAASIHTLRPWELSEFTRLPLRVSTASPQVSLTLSTTWARPSTD